MREPQNQSSHQSGEFPFFYPFGYYYSAFSRAGETNMLQKIIYIILGFSIAFVFMPKNAKDYRGNIRPSILGTNTENIPLIHPSPELAPRATTPPPPFPPTPPNHLAI